jgi:Cytochrome C'
MGGTTMRKVRIIWGAALLAALAAVTAARADDDVEGAKKAILGLVKDLEAKKDIAKKAAAAAESHEIDLVMMGAFKALDKRGRGGLGAGKLGDGIEKAIEKLSDKGIKAAEFKAAQKDLVRLARVNLAVAEITRHHGVARARGPAKQKLWARYNDDMKKAAQGLLKAAEAGQADKIKALATDLNAACTACHSEFK